MMGALGPSAQGLMQGQGQGFNQGPYSHLGPASTSMNGMQQGSMGMPMMGGNRDKNGDFFF